jgi:fibronectin-binding autotransporter adhesin
MSLSKTVVLQKTARTIAIAAAVAAVVFPNVARAAEQFWKTDGTSGTWTNSNWGASASGPFTSSYTTNNDAHFTATSTVTFASATIGNVTVDANKTVTITAGGTATFGGTGSSGAVRTFDIGAGATLTWQSQNMTATSTAGIIKNGTGTLDLGSLTWTTSMNGGYTLNAGTLIVVGNKSLGNGALNLNGGTLQTSGTRDYAPTSIVIGGDFALAGTGNQNWDAASTVALGSDTRTITNNTTSGSRQFRGVISGSSGVGLTFNGNGINNDGGAQIYIGNVANTFTGPIAINGGEVVFNGDGALGATTSITLDGGRLTMASMNTGGTASALTAATISSSKNIFVGSTAGTSISVQGATGITTYDGIIADKLSSTGAWAKQGSGLLKLGGVSTYTGNTAINNGTLQLTTGNNRLPTGTAVSLGQAASVNVGTLDLNGFNQQIAGLNSTSGTNATASNNTVTSATAATLTVGGAGTYSYGDGTNANSGVITGAIALIKSGGGTQTLGDTNTYSGGTSVTGGTLIAGVAGTLGSGSVSVGINGTLEIANTTAGPGVSELSSAISNLALVDVQGSIVLDAGVNEFIGPRLQLGATVYTWAGTDLTFAAVGHGGVNVESSFLSGAGQLTLTPEPASMGLLGLGTIGLLARRRRLVVRPV